MVRPNLAELYQRQQDMRLGRKVEPRDNFIDEDEVRMERERRRQKVGLAALRGRSPRDIPTGAGFFRSENKLGPTLAIDFRGVASVHDLSFAHDDKSSGDTPHQTQLLLHHDGLRPRVVNLGQHLDQFVHQHRPRIPHSFLPTEMAPP